MKKHTEIIEKALGHKIKDRELKIKKMTNDFTGKFDPVISLQYSCLGVNNTNLILNIHELGSLLKDWANYNKYILLSCQEGVCFVYNKEGQLDVSEWIEELLGEGDSEVLGIINSCEKIDKLLKGE